MFKQAVAISKAAIGIAQHHKIERVQIKAAHRMDKVFHFHAVGADILHRCRAHRARNQAQIFQPAQAHIQRVQHKIMPNFTGLRFDIHKAV